MKAFIAAHGDNFFLNPQTFNQSFDFQFQPIAANSSLFRPMPAYTSLCQSMPATFILFHLLSSSFIYNQIASIIHHLIDCLPLEQG